MKAGTVNIGPSVYLSPDTPFGGYGISGVGREHGEDGFREYLQAKTIATPAMPALTATGSDAPRTAKSYEEMQPWTRPRIRSR